MTSLSNHNDVKISLILVEILFNVFLIIFIIFNSIKWDHLDHNLIIR